MVRRAPPKRRKAAPLEHFYQSLDGQFNFREVYDTVLRDAADGAVFVEVGSWSGRSAAYMAVEIANSGKRIELHCVDTWQGSRDTPRMAEQLAQGDGTTFPVFRENLERGGVWRRVTPHVKSSTEAAADFAPESVDFVMLAAAHDFASVRADVRAWLPRLKRGGVMAGDHANRPGVLIAAQDSIPSSEVSFVNDGANWIYRKQRPARGSWTHRRRRRAPTEYFAFIPCVNRVDLLDRAVESVRALWPGLVVIDQTPDGLRVGDHPWMKEIGGVFRVTAPDLSFTQVMNWAQAEAFERGAEFLVFMHNDAECVGDVAERVLEHARQRPKAGVVFTHYDAFAVFRVRALQDAGPWDETFRWYHSDVDYYRRLHLAGWQAEDFGGTDVRHHTSQTLQADGGRAQQVGQDRQWNENHYGHKWGGPQGQERFDAPYDGHAW